MTSFTKQYEYTLPEGEGSDEYSATIYYSKPDRHKQEITYGEENTGSFPEEVAGESEMLYSEANIAYFDIINCYDLRHNEYGGIKGDLLTKQDLIEGSIDENLIKMPCESWSDSYGIYISSK